MAGRPRKLIRQELGVKLEWIESEQRKGKAGGSHYRLSSYLPTAARVFADRDLADVAFEREVEATKLDPVAMRMAGV